jgi:GNAT superfamily N-acetyltransferase
VSWQPLNLAHLTERPPVRPDLGGLGLLYRGKRHVFSGPQEAVKTLTAYAIALEVIRQGELVVLIDLEMGQWDARDRFRELGATADDFERLLYLEPDTPATAEIVLELLEHKPALVIVDAAAGAYDLQGLDDNKRADVERFARIFVRSFWLQGVATLLLDHVVKNAEARGRYAIGSERKVGGADVHLGFEVVTPLTRGGLGLYKIATHKDRPGWLPRPRAGELELRSDPDTHAISWTFRPPADEGADAFRPTVLMERVSSYLEQQTEPVSRKAVEADVTGKRAFLRLAVDRLVAEGFAVESSGDHGARLVRSVRPFRADDVAPSSPPLDGFDLAPPSPPAEPPNHAESATSPIVAPTSPLAPERDLAPDRSRLQGGARWRGEVVTGDPMYPVLLAEARQQGHITEHECSDLYAHHKLVERAREARA